MRAAWWPAAIHIPRSQDLRTENLDNILFDLLLGQLSTPPEQERRSLVQQPLPLLRCQRTLRYVHQLNLT